MKDLIFQNVLVSLVSLSRTIKTKHWDTQIVSYLSNFEEGEEDAVEEAEEGELEEEVGDGEEIDLVLESSADLD